MLDNMDKLKFIIIIITILGCDGQNSKNENSDQERHTDTIENKVLLNNPEVKNKKKSLGDIFVESFLVSDSSLYTTYGLINGAHYYHSDQLDVLLKLDVAYPVIKFTKYNLSDNFKRIADHFLNYKEQGFLINDSLFFFSYSKVLNPNIIVRKNRIIEFVNNDKIVYHSISEVNYKKLMSNLTEDKIYFYNEKVNSTRYKANDINRVVHKTLIGGGYIDSLKKNEFQGDDVNLLIYFLVEKDKSLGGLKCFWRNAGLKDDFDYDKLPSINGLTSSLNDAFLAENKSIFGSATLNNSPIRFISIYNVNIGILIKKSNEI